MSIDADTTGNTATTVTTIENCIQAAAGASVTLDITAQGISAFNDAGDGSAGTAATNDSGGLIGYQFDLGYDSSVLSVTAADTNFMLGANAGSSIFNAGETTFPDTDGNYAAAALDTGVGVLESGSGVLERVTIAVSGTAPIGQYTLSLSNASHLDATGAAYVPDVANVGAIAVGQACVPVPTLTPVPTPPPTPTPGPPTCATPAPASGMCVMAIDTLVGGNTNATIGTIDQCARINENNLTDADETAVDIDGDTVLDTDVLLIDITAQGIPAYNDNGTPTNPADDTGGILGFQYQLQYPPFSLTVAAQSLQSGNPFAPVTSLIDVNAGSNIFDASTVVPDDNVAGVWGGTALDTGTGPLSNVGANIESGPDGVLQRLAITTEAAAAAGQVLLTLANNAHLDASGQVYSPTNTLIANIAINRACSALLTPTPSPSPSPTPAPTPPPTQPPTPPRTSTPSPTATASPSPSATRTATPTATASPGPPTDPPAPPLPPGFHDARAARISASHSVNLSGNGTAKVTFTVVNDGNHFETIGVYLDVIPPTDGNCSPAGRIRQTVVNLNPRDRVTLTVDGYPGDPMPGDGKVTFSCSQPVAAQGQNFTLILGVDAHADDLASCPPNALISATCLARRNDDDADGVDNTRIRTSPTVVIR